MRFIHFTAWCARQKADGGFARLAPDWGTESFWKQEIHDLDQQRQDLAERERRLADGVRPTYKRVDTCAAEFESLSMTAGKDHVSEMRCANGKSRQQGRFGGLMITPRFGLSGPGQLTPI